VSSSFFIALPNLLGSMHWSKLDVSQFGAHINIHTSCRKETILDLT